MAEGGDVTKIPVELEELLASTCAALRVTLYDLELSRDTLLVTVDRDHGIDLDTVTEVARVLSAALDEHETLLPAEHYELEVSTPGLERRLRRPGHFRAVLGSEISVRLVPGNDGQRRFEAVLLAVDESGIEIKDGESSRSIPFSAIERAHLIFDWKAALAAPRGAEEHLDEPDGDVDPELEASLMDAVNTTEERA